MARKYKVSWRMFGSDVWENDVIESPLSPFIFDTVTRPEPNLGEPVDVVNISEFKLVAIDE
jgi:hypothetical protein